MTLKILIVGTYDVEFTGQEKHVCFKKSVIDSGTYSEIARVIKRSSVCPSVCPVDGQQQRRPATSLPTATAALAKYKQLVDKRGFS